MKLGGWTETRAVNSVISSGGVVEWKKDDFVMVVVVRRWEDIPAELARIAAMHKPEPEAK